MATRMAGSHPTWRSRGWRTSTNCRRQDIRHILALSAERACNTAEQPVGPAGGFREDTRTTRGKLAGPRRGGRRLGRGIALAESGVAATPPRRAWVLARVLRANFSARPCDCCRNSTQCSRKLSRLTCPRPWQEVAPSIRGVRPTASPGVRAGPWIRQSNLACGAK
jgi:hypothetical protein